jgi:glucan-binding YG repeat protein
MKPYVLRRKKEWFIQNEVAEIYKENGDFDKAFKYAIEAINNFGDLEYKVGLLVLIANILEQKQEKELSFKHYMLSKLLRQQEEWKVPQTLDYALQNLGFAQIPLEQLPNLKRELKNYWNTFKQEQTKTFNKSKTTTNENIEGEIIEIRNNNERGKDGFLKSNGQKYYFSVSSNFHLSPNIMVGKKVLFEIIPATDNKKEQTRLFGGICFI